MRSSSFVLLGLLVCLPGVSAQAVDTPEGPVEFVGLERWTVDMVIDSLGTQTPRPSPTQYPVALRRLGFPRASVERTLAPAPTATVPQASTGHVLVTVVEPHRAPELSLRGGFESDREPPESWATTDDLYQLDNPIFLAAVGSRLIRGIQGVTPIGPGSLGTAERVWSALDRTRSPEDLTAARDLLGTHRQPERRAVAASILGGFPEEESAWLDLVGALLDPSARVSAVANLALGSMIVAAPRNVEWASSVATLRTLIAGANLAGFPTVLQVLVSTEVSPSLAAALLTDNTHLVLGHLASDASPHRETAHRFLVHLSGRDLGFERDEWRGWIEGL